MANRKPPVPESVQLTLVLEDPGRVLGFDTPTEKVLLAAVQEKPELAGLLPSATEKACLSAVIRQPESVLSMPCPSPKVCFAAAESLLGVFLFPDGNTLEATTRLIARMKRNRQNGMPDNMAIEEFLGKVCPFGRNDHKY